MSAAEMAETIIERVLLERNIDLHVVSGRAKEPVSVLGKIREKDYGNPYIQLTDRLGVRVITYFNDDVDKAVAVLRANFRIDERRTEDKRKALGLREFGYSSVHLQLEATSPAATAEELGILEGRWLEVRVRSILEHAWAEIEHEIVYKSGIKHSDDTKRLFSSLAGALSILDREFLSLRGIRAGLIEEHRARYVSGEDLDSPLDAARLLGLLEARRPRGLSWREAEDRGTPFPPRIESVCVDALAMIGVETGRQLDDVLKGSRFKRLIANFSSLEGIPTSEASHLACAVTAVGASDQDVLREQFPDMAASRSLIALFGL